MKTTTQANTPTNEKKESKLVSGRLSYAFGMLTIIMGLIVHVIQRQQLDPKNNIGHFLLQHTVILPILIPIIGYIIVLVRTKTELIAPKAKDEDQEEQKAPKSIIPALCYSTGGIAGALALAIASSNPKTFDEVAFVSLFFTFIIGMIVLREMWKKALKKQILRIAQAKAEAKKSKTATK